MPLHPGRRKLGLLSCLIYLHPMNEKSAYTHNDHFRAEHLADLQAYPSAIQNASLLKLPDQLSSGKIASTSVEWVLGETNVRMKTMITYCTHLPVGFN